MSTIFMTGWISFWRQCFAGTGFKVKVADAIARHKPLLCSTHAALGVKLPPNLVFETPAALANAMCDIALSRTSLAAVSEQVALSQQLLVQEEEVSAGALNHFVMNARDSLVIDLSRLSEMDDAVRIFFWIAFSERFLKHDRIIVVLPDALWKNMRGVAADRLVFVGGSDPRLMEMERGHRVVVRRVGGVEISALSGQGSVLRLDFNDRLVVPELQWHPSMDALRRIVLPRSGLWSTAMHYVFTAGEASNSFRELFAGAVFIDVTGPTLWPVASFLMLDRRAGVAVTWLGGYSGTSGYCFASLALARDIDFNGVIGPAALVNSQLHAFRGEMYRLVKERIASAAGRLTELTAA